MKQGTLLELITKDVEDRKREKEEKAHMDRAKGQQQKRRRQPTAKAAAKSMDSGKLYDDDADIAGPSSNGAAAAAAGAHADVATVASDLITCALCTNDKTEAQIAITVGGQAFCDTCDHIRRRANNLGLQSRDVTSTFQQGQLAGWLGLTQASLDAQIGHPRAQDKNAPIGAKRAGALAAAAPASGGKSGSQGRMCRMCRQVRAPIVGAFLQNSLL